MLPRIPGIDPVILHNVKERTQKQIVHDTQKLKIAEREQKEKGRQWLKQGKREELALFLEELNEELEKENRPIRLYLVEEEGRWLVHVVEVSTGKILQRLSLRQASHLLSRPYSDKGLLLDHKV